MEHRTITYVPGLYNIFNEIRTNARDHHITLKNSEDKYQITE